MSSRISRPIRAYFSVVVARMSPSDVILYLSPNCSNITFIYLCIYKSLAVLAGCRKKCFISDSWNKNLGPSSLGLGLQ